MQTYQRSLFARNDTLLGVCQAVGEDLGFNPTWLWVAFAIGLFFSLGMAVAAYLGLGAIVLATRLLYRAPRKLTPETVPAAPMIEAAPVAAQNDEEFVPMAAAA